EAMEALDGSFDALVTEALRPRTSDTASVASLRALTDLEVWRTLRDGGATPQAAGEEASAAGGGGVGGRAGPGRRGVVEPRARRNDRRRNGDPRKGFRTMVDFVCERDSERRSQRSRADGRRG